MRGEGDRIDAVLVALLTLRPLDQSSLLRVPDTHALVQRACGDEPAVRRDGDSGDAIFDLEGEHALILLDVPQPNGAVSRTGRDEAAIAREVERVDVLVVSGEGMTNLLCGDVPHPDDFVFGTGSEVSAIRTETDATDVEITVLLGVVILQVADLLARVHVKDLRAAVTSSRDVIAVRAEANTTHHALMREIVYQVNIEPTDHPGVEDRMPILTLPLQMWWKLVWVEFRQLVADLIQLSPRVLKVGSYLLISVGRRGRTDVGGRRPGIGGRLGLMGSRGAADVWRASEPRLTWARRSGLLRRLWAISWTPPSARTICSCPGWTAYH